MIKIFTCAPCALGPVQAVTLQNEGGMAVTVLTLGATIQRLCVKDARGVIRDVCLGYGTAQAYLDHDGYFGAAIGRNGNRIAGARFTLGGQVYPLSVNDGRNQLHGGITGFDKKIWSPEIDANANAVTFSTRLRDGEEGFPGNMDVKITYTLTADNALRIDYWAQSDADTVANFTNHTYFNLNGQDGSTILDHLLSLQADHYTPANEETLPTGEIVPVDGSCMDFRTPLTIRDGLADASLARWQGYDHNFCLSGKGLRAVGTLRSPDSGIVMQVQTTLEGIQLYTGSGLTRRTGKDGAVYGRYGGLCLETQHYPDAPNQPHFPTAILKQGETCQETTIYRFATQ